MNLRPGQHHFHLQNGGVLRFTTITKAFCERSTHECAATNRPGRSRRVLRSFIHLAETHPRSAEGRIIFSARSPGNSRFSCFHGRARDDDPIHTLLLQRLHSRRHSEKRFARPAGPTPKIRSTFITQCPIVHLPRRPQRQPPTFEAASARLINTCANEIAPSTSLAHAPRGARQIGAIDDAPDLLKISLAPGLARGEPTPWVRASRDRPARLVARSDRGRLPDVRDVAVERPEHRLAARR